eukprot:7739294-Alexandrium_andersonii.AAC.1
MARGTARRSRPVQSLGGLLRAVPSAIASTRPSVGCPLAGSRGRTACWSRLRTNRVGSAARRS